MARSSSKGRGSRRKKSRRTRQRERLMEEESFRSWLFRDYLRWWYWIGLFLLATMVSGSMKPYMSYPGYMYVVAETYILFCMVGFIIFRRIWPKKPE